MQVDRVHSNISAAKAVDREFEGEDIAENLGFFGFLNFLTGFWGPGGVPVARSRNFTSDGLRESPR